MRLYYPFEVKDDCIYENYYRGHNGTTSRKDDGSYNNGYTSPSDDWYLIHGYLRRDNREYWRADRVLARKRHVIRKRNGLDEGFIYSDDPKRFNELMDQYISKDPVVSNKAKKIIKKEYGLDLDKLIYAKYH